MFSILKIIEIVKNATFIILFFMFTLTIFTRTFKNGNNIFITLGLTKELRGEYGFWNVKFRILINT